MPFPNPRALVISYLAPLLDPVKVATRVPTKRPDAFVRVVHVGGPGRLNPAIEEVRMVVESWDVNEVAAESRANEIREHLAKMPSNSVYPVYRYREVSAPSWLSDVSETPCFSFMFTMRLRNASA